MYGTLETKPLQNSLTESGEIQGPANINNGNNNNNGDNSNNNGFLTSADSKWIAEQETRRRKRIYSHCHVQSVSPDGSKKSDPHQHGVDKSARRRLIAASIICLVFMIGEVVGGVLSNSLAIATDAAHLLTDFASFMISLFAIWLSSRPASKKMSFGWYRAEVIGALVSVLMIWLVTGLLVYMAVERLRTHEFEIDSLVMVITASAGLLVNIIMAIALNVDGHSHGFHSHGHSHGHSHSHHDHLHDNEIEDDNHNHHQHAHNSDSGHENSSKSHSNENSHIVALANTGGSNISNGCGSSSNGCNSSKNKHSEDGRGRKNINVRAAFIHVIGDFLQSLGVLIAALVIHFEPSYAIIDPICTFLFSIIVLITTINIIRDATNVLMEGIPDGINFIEVKEKLQSLPFVIRVHNLRIWSLSLDKIAISSHLVINSDRVTPSQALKKAIDTLKSSYNFFEVTIQIEEYRDDMKDCEQCQDEEVVININDNLKS